MADGMKGRIFALHRFSVHDGPGIRTTVFLKGCPLRCMWCHNPESLDPEFEIAWIAHCCVSCGRCVCACPSGAHRLENGRHRYDRSVCRKCGRCADACVFGSLEFTGKEMEAGEVVAEVLKDSVFYEESGGGVTVSGGEPLSQWQFVRDLLSELRLHHVHTAVETCGFGPPAAFQSLLPVTDLFLFDIKAMDPDKHVRLTGSSNDAILRNLDFLMSRGARVVLRCPLVPGLNDSDEDLQGLAQLCSRYPDLAGLELLPYHNTGNDKYVRYGRNNPLPGLPSATTEDRERWRAFFIGAGISGVKVA